MPSFAGCLEEYITGIPCLRVFPQLPNPPPVGIAQQLDMGNSDGWVAPPGEKVTFAFGIIWFLASLVQLFFILKRLKLIPSMAARGPYILLSVITLSLALNQVLYAVYVRTFRNRYVVYDDSLFLSGHFFWILDTAFRPAVVLYLVHQRGDVLRAVKGNRTFPLSTRTWKRIMDWVLVAIALIMYLGSMGAEVEQLAAEDRHSNYRQIENLYQISLRLFQTGLAFQILLCIDIGVSLTFQTIQGKGTHDPILNHLTRIILPLFCVYLFELAFFDIFPLIATRYDNRAVSASASIIDGAVRIAITTVLILTMTLPGVWWTPQQVVASGATPGALQESPLPSPEKSEYTPQQQPASYWPQPHVLPHEMPDGISHEGNPYARALSPGATHPVLHQPVAEVHSVILPQHVAEVHSIIPPQQRVSRVAATTSPSPTQAMPSQPLYPASMRAMFYQSPSPAPASSQPPTYQSPSLGSTQTPTYQIPPSGKAAPEQYKSAPSPTGELFTYAVLPQEKTEKTENR